MSALVICRDSSVHDKPLVELTEEAIRILYRELGTVNTVRFLRQFSPNLGDYTRAPGTNCRRDTR